MGGRKDDCVIPRRAAFSGDEGTRGMRIKDVAILLLTPLIQAATSLSDAETAAKSAVRCGQTHQAQSGP